MKNLYKRAAAREGFTLVELIVVIAILGILAGIAIPVYSGYISKAREAADYQLLDSVKTAAVFAAVDNDVNAVVTKIETGNQDVTSVTITYNSGEETGKTLSGDISSYVGTGAALKTLTGATWTPANGWVPAS